MPKSKTIVPKILRVYLEMSRKTSQIGTPKCWVAVIKTGTVVVTKAFANEFEFENLADATAYIHAQHAEKWGFHNDK